MVEKHNKWWYTAFITIHLIISPVSLNERVFRLKQYSASQIRNLAILGHGGSGKTTLADAILCFGKATERIGKTADSTTVMDFDPEEKKRKVSVSAAVYPLETASGKLNIIDAPGLFDFAGGAVEAVSAADSVLIAMSGKSGLTVGAEQSFDRAKAARKRARAAPVTHFIACSRQNDCTRCAKKYPPFFVAAFDLTFVYVRLAAAPVGVQIFLQRLLYWLRSSG